MILQISKIQIYKYTNITLTKLIKHKFTNIYKYYSYDKSIEALHSLSFSTKSFNFSQTNILLEFECENRKILLRNEMFPIVTLQSSRNGNDAKLATKERLHRNASIASPRAHRLLASWYFTRLLCDFPSHVSCHVLSFLQPGK